MLIDQGNSSVDNDSIYCDMTIAKAQAQSRTVEKSLVDQKVEISVNVKPFLKSDASAGDVQLSCTNIGDTFQAGSISSDTSDVELVSDDIPECDRVVDIGLGVHVTKEQLIVCQQSDPSLKLARSEDRNNPPVKETGYDKCSRKKVYEVGEEVLVLFPSSTRCLETQWQGLTSSQRQKINDVLLGYYDVFSDIPSKTNIAVHHIEAGYATPVI